MPSFIDRITQIQTNHDSLLCIGLDPDPDLLPGDLKRQSVADAVLAFNAAIINATCHAASAYKLNLAFYESLGSAGWRILERTMLRIPPEIVTIADGKRGDIGNSARMYAQSVFVNLEFDACTVQPYMGRDSVEPFLEQEARAAFILARTSNPGSADFQLMQADGLPLFEQVARYAVKWNRELPGTAGLVMGATHPESLETIAPLLDASTPLLIPGVGVQGGDTRKLFTALNRCRAPVLINSSRKIIYASAGKDFESAAARSADLIRDELNAARSAALQE